MITVLFLDDDAIRHDMFLINNTQPGVEIQQCWTAKSATKCLKEMPKFSFAFLDHDLAEAHYSGKDYDTGTGMEVVNYICKMKPDARPETVVIHSWNTMRAIEMEKRLLDAGLRWDKVIRRSFDAIKYIQL